MVYFVTHEEPAGACICASFPDSAGARAYIAANATPGSSLSDPLTIRAASALMAVQWGRVDPLEGIDRNGEVYRDALAAFRALDVDGAPPLPSVIRLRLDLADAEAMAKAGEQGVAAARNRERYLAAALELPSIERLSFAESPLLAAREFLEKMDSASVAVREGAGASALMFAAWQCVAAIHSAALDGKASASEWNGEAKAAARAREDMENRYRAESIRANGLESELAEAREALAEWKAKADKAESDCLTYRQQRDAEGARAHAAETALEGSRAYAEKGHGALDRLMRELSGLTLGMLPPGAYGASLVDIYCDIKAGR